MKTGRHLTEPEITVSL